MYFPRVAAGECSGINVNKDGTEPPTPNPAMIRKIINTTKFGLNAANIALILLMEREINRLLFLPK